MSLPTQTENSLPPIALSSPVQQDVWEVEEDQHETENLRKNRVPAGLVGLFSSNNEQ